MLGDMMNYEKSCGAVIYRYREENLEFLLVKSKTNGHLYSPKDMLDLMNQKRKQLEEK